MKKLCSLIILAAALFLVDGELAAASDNSNRNITEYYQDVNEGCYADSLILSVDSDRAIVDGNVQTGMAVRIADGRVWLPLRFVAENLGWQVAYGQSGITLQAADRQIQIVLGSSDIIINGSRAAIEQAPYAKDGVTWLPLRDIGEALGKNVDWQTRYPGSDQLLEHGLVFIYDPDGEFPTAMNTVGIDRLYEHYVDLLHDTKNMVFADKYLTVYRQEDKLFLDSFFCDNRLLNDGAAPVVDDRDDKQSYGSLGVWHQTASGWLLQRSEGNAWDLRGRDTLYYLDDPDVRLAKWQRLAEEISFAGIRFDETGVVVLRNFNNEEVWDYNTTNLTYYDFATGEKHSLGTPGYFYGFSLAGGLQDWYIADGKVYISGYDRRLATPTKDRQASYQQFILSLR